MPSKLDISVIIVSYNCLEPLRECLQSLDSPGESALEIIVVDNDSHDGTPEFLRSQPVISFFPGENLGYGAAVNLGAQKAQGKYLLIINPDTVILPGALKALFDFSECHSGFGLISPLLVHPDGALQISAREFPQRRVIVFGRGSPLHKLGFTRERQAGYFENLGEGPVRVPAVSATAILIQSTLFRELNGFDERYFMYMEDIDLCRRLRDLNRDIWILPPVKIKHAWRKSSSKRPYFTSFHHHISVYKYFRKFYPHEWLKNTVLLLMLLAGFILNTLIIAVKGKGR